MRLIRCVPFCALFTLSTLCLAQSKAARDAAKAGSCGPDADNFSAHRVSDAGTPSAPTDGKALIYIVEVQDKFGSICVKCAITAKVGVDGKWVGATSGDSFLVITVDAGQHHLCTTWQSDWPARAHLTGLNGFTAESGKVYYFRTHVAIATENTPDRFTLEPIDSDEGRLLIASSKRSESAKKQ